MKTFYKKESLFFYQLRAAFVCALLYCIPMFILLFKADFESVWLLYIGSGLFLFGIVTSILLLNRKLKGDVTIATLMQEGLKIVVGGIIIISIIVALTILIAFSHVFSGLPTKEILADSPANMIAGGDEEGLIYVLFMSAVFANFAAGAFATLIGSLSATRKISNMGDQ